MIVFLCSATFHTKIAIFPFFPLTIRRLRWRKNYWFTLCATTELWLELSHAVQNKTNTHTTTLLINLSLQNTITQSYQSMHLSSITFPYRLRLSRDRLADAVSCTKSSPLLLQLRKKTCRFTVVYWVLQRASTGTLLTLTLLRTCSPIKFMNEWNLNPSRNRIPSSRAIQKFHWHSSADNCLFLYLIVSVSILVIPTSSSSLLTHIHARIIKLSDSNSCIHIHNQTWRRLSHTVEFFSHLDRIYIEDRRHVATGIRSSKGFAYYNLQYWVTDGARVYFTHTFLPFFTFPFSTRTCQKENHKMISVFLFWDLRTRDVVQYMPSSFEKVHVSNFNNAAVVDIYLIHRGRIFLLSHHEVFFFV